MNAGKDDLPHYIGLRSKRTMVTAPSVVKDHRPQHSISALADIFNDGQRLNMDTANVENEPIPQVSPPRVTAHDANAPCIARGEFFDARYIPPPCGQFYGVVYGISDCVYRAST